MKIARPDWEHELAITGLTDDAFADPLSIIGKFSGSLLVPIDENQINDYKVLPVVSRKPRILLVEFVNTRTRNSWLKAMKTKRKILLSDLKSMGPSNRIYINERSTAIERKTLIEAKKYAKIINFKYC